MKKKIDEPYLLSCTVALVMTSYIAYKITLLKIVDVSSESERLFWCILLAEILFIVLQRYLLMIFRGYKRYFDNHR